MPPQDVEPLGAALRAHRERLSMTQVQVADGLARLAWERRELKVGVNADMVSKWERGTKAVSPLYREMYCALFRVSSDELGFVSTAVPLLAVSETHAAMVMRELGAAAHQLGPVVLDVWKEEALRRRTLLKMLGTTPAAVAFPGHAESGVPTPAGLDELADKYQSLYHSADPLDLMAPVVTHLRTIDRLIRRGASPILRRRLLVNRSRVGTLAGRIAFFDLGDPLGARGYFTTAAEAAGEADEPLLAAAALGHMAFIPASEGSFSAAQDYLRGAGRQLDARPHHRVGAWLAAVESEVLANAGTPALALGACDRAEQWLTESTPETLAWFDYFDATRLNGFRGYAELQAGRLTEARTALTAAADALPEEAVKQRAVFLADLVSVELERHDVDEACRLASQSVRTLQVAGYATGSDRVADLRAQLGRWAGHPGVRELDDLLAAEPGPPYG